MEFFAIYKGLDYILNNKKVSNKFNIFSDSRSALLSINSNLTKHYLVSLIKKNLSLIPGDIVLDFYWIPGHTGIRGNERADSLAKKATRSFHPFRFGKVPITFIKGIIWQTIFDLWQRDWNNTITSRNAFSFLPYIKDRLANKNFSPNFHLSQIITGHGNFNSL